MLRTAVQVLVSLRLPTMLVVMNWKESVFKVSTVSQSWIFTWFPLVLTPEKAKAAGYKCNKTGFNDLQKPEFMKHDNHEVSHQDCL